MVKKQTIENILEIFRDSKIMTINEFIALIRCSIPTIRLYLKRWEVLRSYNKNGIYYVLPDIPRFNKYGIWQYKEVYFSKHGDLTKTIIGVIDRSKNGLDALEINNILEAYVTVSFKR